ncbi:MAG: FHA domain-containing protein [Oscillospiraceae bacterium]|nr:FHA domain-containing protein [Oscillospiraceae bacterium]
MTLTRCNNGHFYDEDKFNQCPHCESAGRNSDNTVAMNRNNNVTVGLTQNDLQDTATAQLGQSPGASLSGAVQDVINSGMTVPSGNEGVTVSYYNRAIGTEPCVGWLVCVEGNHLGEDFRLKSGRNFIGRATGMDVVLSGDNTVSREKHAIVLYDPENHQFLVQPGDARELCYLNDKLVLSSMELRINDILKVGATRLMFFPCCTDVFHWGMVEKIDE